MMCFIMIGMLRFVIFVLIRQLSVSVMCYLQVVRYGSSDWMVCQLLCGLVEVGVGLLEVGNWCMGEGLCGDVGFVF